MEAIAILYLDGGDAWEITICSYFENTLKKAYILKLTFTPCVMVISKPQYKKYRTLTDPNTNNLHLEFERKSDQNI